MVDENEVNEGVGSCSSLQHNYISHPNIKITGSSEVLTLKMIGAVNNKVCGGGGKLEQILSSRTSLTKS